MKFFEFGKEHKKLMVMLHGGGVSYLGAVPVAEYVSKKIPCRAGRWAARTFSEGDNEGAFTLAGKNR